MASSPQVVSDELRRAGLNPETAGIARQFLQHQLALARTVGNPQGMLLLQQLRLMRECFGLDIQWLRAMANDPNVQHLVKSQNGSLPSSQPTVVPLLHARTSAPSTHILDTGSRIDCHQGSLGTGPHPANTSETLCQPHVNHVRVPSRTTFGHVEDILLPRQQPSWVQQLPLAAPLHLVPMTNVMNVTTASGPFHYTGTPTRVQPPSQLAAQLGFGHVAHPLPPYTVTSTPHLVVSEHMYPSHSRHPPSNPREQQHEYPRRTLLEALRHARSPVEHIAQDQHFPTASLDRFSELLDDVDPTMVSLAPNTAQGLQYQPIDRPFISLQSETRESSSETRESSDVTASQFPSFRTSVVASSLLQPPLHMYPMAALQMPLQPPQLLQALQHDATRFSRSDLELQSIVQPSFSTVSTLDDAYSQSSQHSWSLASTSAASMPINSEGYNAARRVANMTSERAVRVRRQSRERYWRSKKKIEQQEREQREQLAALQARTRQLLAEKASLTNQVQALLALIPR